MSTTSHPDFAKDSWQTPRNARTLRAYMALRQQEIGQRIAELRQQRGNPPQEVVAAKLGVSYRAYQAWEAGDAKPAYRNLERLAEYYGVNEDYILTGARAGEPSNGDESQLDRIDKKLDRVLSLLEGGRGQAGLQEQLGAIWAALDPAHRQEPPESASGA